MQCIVQIPNRTLSLRKTPGHVLIVFVVVENRCRVPLSSNRLQLTLIKSDRYLKEEELELVRVRIRGAISLSSTLYGLTARLSVRHLFILSAQRQIPQPSHPEGQVSRGTRLRQQTLLAIELLTNNCYDLHLLTFNCRGICICLRSLPSGKCIFRIFICLHSCCGTDVSSNQPPASFPHLGDQPLTTTNNFATLSTFPSFLFITTSIYRDGSTMCTAQCICQYSPRVDVCL